MATLAEEVDIDNPESSSDESLSDEQIQALLREAESRLREKAATSKDGFALAEISTKRAPSKSRAGGLSKLTPFTNPKTANTSARPTKIEDPVTLIQGKPKV